jgi:hypothetical protein
VTQREFFEKVLSAFAELDTAYMIAGSVGAMLYGEPRMTNDMDVVVELPIGKAGALAERFKGEAFYFPPLEVVQNEVRRRGQFNIIHVESGSKVDVIIRKDGDFAETEFSRRRKVPFSEALEAISASPEDIIIAKLKYYAEGGSDKHLEDIRGILQVSGDEIDRQYIEKWTGHLGLGEHWAKVQSS